MRQTKTQQQAARVLEQLRLGAVLELRRDAMGQGFYYLLNEGSVSGERVPNRVLNELFSQRPMPLQQDANRPGAFTARQ